MKVSGSCSLVAPPAAVFEAIRDPGVLLAVIPGC
jgi:carbon monoxide dehydrogenase subunit G